MECQVKKAERFSHKNRPEIGMMCTLSFPEKDVRRENPSLVRPWIKNFQTCEVLGNSEFVVVVRFVGAKERDLIHPSFLIPVLSEESFIKTLISNLCKEKNHERRK